MTSLPISLNRFRKTYCYGLSRSQTLKAFDRFINDGTLPAKQEVKQEEVKQEQGNQEEVKKEERIRIYIAKHQEIFIGKVNMEEI
jgi:hypothetical protein